MVPNQVLPLPFRLDPGVIAMNGYSILHRAPELEPYHRIQFIVIYRTLLFGFHHFARDSISVFRASLTERILVREITNAIKC